MKTSNKREFQEIASKHSSDVEIKGFLSLDKYYTKGTFLYFANNTTLPSNNPLRFRQNLL